MWTAKAGGLETHGDQGDGSSDANGPRWRAYQSGGLVNSVKPSITKECAQFSHLSCFALGTHVWSKASRSPRTRR